MKLRSLLFTVSFCLAAFPALAIDFTPHYLDYYINYILKRRLYFLDGSQKIGLKISNDAKVDAFGGGARIQFPAYKDASYLMLNSPVDAKTPFAAGIDVYRKQAAAYLPAGIKDLKAESETANPLTMFGWTSQRFRASFSIGGKRAVQEVTFLNLKPGQQIVLIATAYEPDFAEFEHRTYNIIRSWNPLTAADEAPLPYN